MTDAPTRVADSETTPRGGDLALEQLGAGRRRELLPALEADRRLDDWGRSERIEGAVDATVTEFLYRYWFRCEVEGIDNVPADGGALIAANRAAGPLPPGALMIGKAIREEHPRPRRHFTVIESFLKGYPGLSMLVAKVGGVPAHPANVHRLLADEGELVLAFPEGGREGGRLYRDRYRVQPFGGVPFVEAAMAAHARIVPACVVGAEEAMPVLGRARIPSRLGRLSSLPITPTFPWLGPLGLGAFLPARFKLRFLPPIDTSRMGADPTGDRSLVRSVTQEVRARIQENLHDMLGSRRSAWTG